MLKELKWVDGETEHDMCSELVVSDGDMDAPLAIISPADYDGETYEGVVIIMIGKYDTTEDVKKAAIDLLKKAGKIQEIDGTLYSV